jgi:hypothetical protein
MTQYCVIEEEAGTYEVWTKDRTEFIEAYDDYQTAVTTANRLEEES